MLEGAGGWGVCEVTPAQLSVWSYLIADDLAACVMLYWLISVEVPILAPQTGAVALDQPPVDPHPGLAAGGEGGHHPQHQM